jgi:hypothetical protein
MTRPTVCADARDRQSETYTGTLLAALQVTFLAGVDEVPAT